jgi:hypothetical protein
MSEWYDNQSAEVVLRQPRKLDATHCLPKCLKLFTRREISWLLKVEGDKRDGDARALALGISIAESKKIQARMVKCLKKCIAAAEEKAWNDDPS